MKINIIQKCLILGILLAAKSHAADLATLEAALKLAYPEAGAVYTPSAVTLSAQEEKELNAALGSKIFSPACQAYLATLKGKPLGLALLDDELGKHRPMTFLVALDAAHKVKRVELLAYRERYGQGVQARKFMAQFEGKGGRDALLVGQGIDAVTGATISSKSISLGVRKALKVADKFKETAR